MARWHSIAIALLTFPSVSALLGLQPSSHAADQPPLSAAQIALFESDHLAKIKSPATLDYKFQHTGSEPYEDSVALVVREVHDDGSKDVSVEFLNGEHRMEFSPVTRFRGNPLIMYFLEWDVRGMHKATGGSALYFRNRIREGFVDEAEMADASIIVSGRPEAATAITLQPYRHDPGTERYAAFRDKSYRFVLSDAVPGKVYEIEASLSGGAEEVPAVVDRVTFEGMRE
jgi:hypothetical protein